MTYIEYYKQRYGLTLTNNKQPLLKVIKGYKKEFAKGGKELIKKPEYVYLIPEFVSPTGMTDEQRADHNAMKALSPFTKLTPQERVDSCQFVIEDINKANGLIQIKQAKRFEGYLLNPPDLLYSDATIHPDNRGNIKHRGTLKEAFNFSSWLFVYSLGKQPKRSDEEADNAVNLLQTAGKTYGIKFANPSWLTMDSNKIQHWKEDL